jgi:hypothetical protein
MRIEIMRSAFFASALALQLTAAVSGHAAQNTQASQSASHISTPQRLAAGGNPAICKANYDHCVGACDGMSGCINQCASNYRGCLGQ